MLSDRDGIPDRGARPLSFTARQAVNGDARTAWRGGRRRDPVTPAPVGSVPGRRGMCRGRAGAPHQPVAVGDGTAALLASTPSQLSVLEALTVALLLDGSGRVRREANSAILQ
jgi:hypothetical protein